LQSNHGWRSSAKRGLFPELEQEKGGDWKICLQWLDRNVKRVVMFRVLHLQLLSSNEVPPSMGASLQGSHAIKAEEDIVRMSRCWELKLGKREKKSFDVFM